MLNNCQSLGTHKRHRFHDVSVYASFSLDNFTVTNYLKSWQKLKLLVLFFFLAINFLLFIANICGFSTNFK